MTFEFTRYGGKVAAKGKRHKFQFSQGCLSTIDIGGIIFSRFNYTVVKRKMFSQRPKF